MILYPAAMHESRLTRRGLMHAAAAAGAAALGTRGATAADLDAGIERAVAEGDKHRGIASISSGNGLPAVEKALTMVQGGADPAVSVVQGVAIVEADPEDLTVGLGGLPNERGVVELDASVMHGPSHKAGAVAALRNIVHPAQVALKVLQTTDHVMLVGEGALDFARAHGFPEQDLLTERSRQIWLRWKRNLSPNDDWLDDGQLDWSRDGASPVAAGPDESPIPFHHGTIHCSAVDERQDLGACTTTSGLSYKIPGRVGDSPIIGAGMYCDNDVGAAGATGRGESVIQSCGAFSIVQEMEKGLAPTEACLAVLKRVSDRSVRQRRLRDERGRPNFSLTCYALRKDGAYGSATMWSGASFTAATVRDGAVVAESIPCAYLYERG